MNEQAGVTISKEQQITYTKKEYSYVISNRDWKRITKTINRLESPSPMWSNVAWGSLGIGISCLLSWFTNKNILWFLIVGCLAFGVAICSFCMAYSVTKKYESSKAHLIEVVEDIEDAIMTKSEDTSVNS